LVVRAPIFEARYTRTMPTPKRMPLKIAFRCVWRAMAQAIPLECARKEKKQHRRATLKWVDGSRPWPGVVLNPRHVCSHA